MEPFATPSLISGTVNGRPPMPAEERAKIEKILEKRKEKTFVKKTHKVTLGEFLKEKMEEVPLGQREETLRLMGLDHSNMNRIQRDPNREMLLYNFLRFMKHLHIDVSEIDRIVIPDKPPRAKRKNKGKENGIHKMA